MQNNITTVDGVELSEEALARICEDMSVSLARSSGLPFGILLQEGDMVARAINGLRQQNDTLFLALSFEGEEGVYKQRIRNALEVHGTPVPDAFSHA